MSTKHTATLPDGTTATRTSANRLYPFAVAVGPRDPEVWAAHLAKQAADADATADTIAAAAAAGRYAVRSRGFGSYAEQGYNGYEVILKGSTVAWHSNRQGQVEDTIDMIGKGRGYIAEAAEFMAVYASHRVDEFRRQADTARDTIAAILDGTADLGAWHVTGWQSRLDLAQKEHARVAGYTGSGEAVVIVTAIEIITK